MLTNTLTSKNIVNKKWKGKSCDSPPVRYKPGNDFLAFGGQGPPGPHPWPWDTHGWTPRVSDTERTRWDGPVHHTSTMVIPLCLNMCDSNLFQKKNKNIRDHETNYFSTAQRWPFHSNAPLITNENDTWIWGCLASSVITNKILPRGPKAPWREDCTCSSDIL